jgi:hypothetical protein
MPVGPPVWNQRNADVVAFALGVVCGHLYTWLRS